MAATAMTRPRLRLRTFRKNRPWDAQGLAGARKSGVVAVTY